MKKFATHVVIRPFQSDGRELKVGEVVDASSWKNVAPLISARFIRPATDADRMSAPPKPSRVSRTFKIRKVG